MAVELNDQEFIVEIFQQPIIVVEQAANEVIIDATPVLVNINPDAALVYEIGIQGPQGVKGDPGPTGPAGGKLTRILFNEPGTYTLTPDQTNVDIDPTLGEIAIILQDVIVMAGLSVILSRISGPGNGIIIQAADGQTINLQPTYVDLVNPFNSITVVGTTETDWRIT